MSCQRLLASGGDRGQALDAGQDGSEQLPGHSHLGEGDSHLFAATGPDGRNREFDLETLTA